MRTFKRLKGLRLHDLRLRYQLMILFLLISLLPSIGLGYLVNWTVSRVLERQAVDHTLQLIGKVNQTLDSDMENLQNMTYLIGFDSGIRSFMTGGLESGADLYQLKQYLQRYTTLYPEIAGLLVVGRGGSYVSNELYARTADNLTREDWYKRAVASEGLFTILGQPSQRNLTSHVNYRDDEVVTVVRAVVDPDTERAIGVVLIDLKLWTVSKAARDVKLGRTGYLTVTDQSGGVIYAPDEPYTDSLPPAWFAGGDSGSVTRNVDGRELQLIYATSSFTGWTTAGVFLTRETGYEVRQIHFYVICFLFLVCLSGLTASLRLSRSISRPISQLMAFMRQAESGDLSVRYEGKRGDEVGMLGRSFNHMLVELRRLIRLSERKERQKREAELRSLQDNIKPHFLYNTLDTIHWMARKKGADEVSEMVESLSKLFRIGLSKGSNIIPLTDELEHIRSYLLIQKTRYKGRLVVDIEAGPETEAGGLFVLKLLLQPLVENAIYHGIKARRGPGRISIAVNAEAGALILTVRDDGAGMEPERLGELRCKLAEPLEALERQASERERSGRSYGMLNVQARLRLAFGEAYGIGIGSEAGEGTVVTVRHPLLTEPPAIASDKEQEEET
ncbi:sensor histidine kinase [Saccharibacillus sp. CPCC 101409]|uniref:cache domain-containing sensor histidine kinase n=1 Tax=Saccharibacillus sp. CPCC 101409 TaxID=3058041 RepID=UPI002671FDD9|nr:sensor histidine kinase [Saccharibacillus sp. CPCC 101409]MDO3410258.1 sensor histidine kinase [Saccharibacillus sp. CPCC 101409]